MDEIKNQEEVIVEEKTVNKETPTQKAVKEDTKEETVNLNFSSIFRVVIAIIGILAILISLNIYNNDLETYRDLYHFDEVSYVGGDAYNYIISASRSAAVMVKSLVWMVFGCTMLIVSCLLRPNKQECK